MTRNTRSEKRRAFPWLIRKAWPKLAWPAFGSARWWATLLAGTLCLVGLVLVSLAFQRKDRPASLTVALWQTPPFMSLNKNGDAVGAIPELLNAAATRAGIRLHWVLHTQGADSAMKPGTGIDIWPLAEVTEERRKRFHLTQPYARGDMLLVQRAGQAGRPIRHLGLRDWPEIRRWAWKSHPDAQKIIRDHGSGLREICEGTLDASLVETPEFDAFLMNRPPSCVDTRLQITMLEGFGTEYGIASTFQARESADLLRHYLGEMAREGALDEIFYRYYPLAHYRSAESFAETSTERSLRFLRWGAGTLFVVCVLFWIAIQRFRRRAAETLAMAELRSRFLARISHELRTPLNGVLGIASVLSSTSLDRAQQEYVGLIRSSGETLLRTVNEVLDFSRLEAGKHSLSFAPVHIEHLVEDVVSILAPVAHQKNLELAWAVEPGVPAAIQSDASALRQILMNLLGNSLKFTEYGIVTLQVRHVTLGHDAAIVRILVSDSGPGIRAGQEEEIFNPYTRGGDASTLAKVGTGLGLSITKQLVILLGGTVRVANDAAGGCTFTVELPVTPAPVHSDPASAWGSGVRLPAHALLLTRRAITGDMLARRLESAGCNVTRASSADLLRENAEPHSDWDLLVIDADIEGNCIDIADTLQRSQAGPVSPVILMTSGIATTELLSRRLPENYFVLPKPFLSVLFISAIEKLGEVAGSSPASSPAGSERRETQPDAVDPLSGAPPGLPPGLPSSLTELLRATQPPATLSPDCVPDGQRCNSCYRDVALCFNEYAAAILSPSGQHRVLVADDNPVNLKVVLSLLQSIGLSCDTAMTGEEALIRYSEASYSWIIMDWHMPEMDGLTAVQKIRDLERRDRRLRTPIVLCTATSEQDAKLAAREGIFDEVISKPISLKSLQTALVVSASRAHGPLSARRPLPAMSESSLPAAPQGQQPWQ